MTDPNPSAQINTDQIESGQLTVADLRPAGGLTDQYDDLLLRLCDTQAHAASVAAINTNANAHTRYCHHLRHALESDTVYICHRHTLDIVATSSQPGSAHCTDTEALHNTLTSMVSDLWNCNGPVYLSEIGVFPGSNKFSYIVTPLDEKRELLLVAVDAELAEDFVDLYFSAAITALHQVFEANDTQLPKRINCESQVFDYLHAKFQNSSNKISALRLKYFKQQLKACAVSFDDIAAENNKTEAPLCSHLPTALYTAANLWGGEFKTALDCHCLTESSYGYKTLCENSELLTFETSRALQIKVHKDTLIDPEYINTLEELTEKCVIHSSRLNLSLITDSPLLEAQDNLLPYTQLKELRPKQAAGDVTLKPVTVANRVNIAEEFNMLETNGISRNYKKAANQS